MKTIQTELPDPQGYYGRFGGRFIPETLINAVLELEEAYLSFKTDESMQRELEQLLKQYAGRPTPIYYAQRLSEETGIKLYFKREDLLHTGAHKLNNTLGQILLAKHMGKTRIIAETGAGQHGVATATVCARMGMECAVYMGELDTQRQAPNVKKMQLLGAQVIPVTSGSRTLKDAINEALRDWVKNCPSTHYLLGSVTGPHPFPMIVRDFQKVIGREAWSQFQVTAGSLPDYGVACVGGGSNAAGFFFPFVHGATKLIGVEAGGRSEEAGQHCLTLTKGRPGIFHGALSYLLQDKEAQVMEVHSLSAGLDYPAVGPEHSFWKEKELVEYRSCTDSQALEACLVLSRTEGIIPALESSHALGYVLFHKERFLGKKVLINLSGRGDKDLEIIFKEAGL